MTLAVITGIIGFLIVLNNTLKSFVKSNLHFRHYVLSFTKND